MHPWRTVGTGYPSAGCSPAEPASVSPGAANIASPARKNKTSKARDDRQDGRDEIGR